MVVSQNKKVSVIVPNYNYGRYLKKRMDSILEQTYPIYELIVLDDASMDGSAEMAKNMVLDLKLKNPEMRVKFVGSDKNSGKAMAAWKKGWELATGDYVWIAEADDLCSKRFLEEVMKGFDDPEVVISYAESKVMNGVGMVIAPNFRWSRDKEKTGHFKKSYTKKGVDEIKEIMAVRCTMPNVSGAVIKRKKKYLKYLEEALGFAQVGDWYFYMKVLEDGKITYNHKALNKFRVHGGSATLRGREHYDEVKKMHEMVEKKYDLSNVVKGRMAAEQERIRKKYGIIGADK